METWTVKQKSEV